MPSENCEAIKTARTMLEYCRFAYKGFAQSCAFPLDPFFESWGPGFKMMPSARDRLMGLIHEELKTRAEDRKFDPIAYRLAETPNPHDGGIYRGGIDDSYILFQPRPLDLSIAYARGYNRRGEAVDGGPQLQPRDGAVRCCWFQGRTGMTQNHPDAGWASYLGAVLYDPRTQDVVITFRGSRSGDGTRALVGAQLKSTGNPDWVTDMNHLKGVKVAKYGNSTLSCGFFYAVESCLVSITAAYRDAVRGPVKNIYVTGHSLGGALAQVAYVDLVCGELGRDLGFMRGDAPSIFCYPISAPPICHGLESQHWLSLHANASNIRHYYNPRDLVHASPLVDGSKTKGMSFGNWVAGGAHPLTDPLHLGSEVALDCDEIFPNAHEPEFVWRGMNSGETQRSFWPTFKLDVISSVSSVSSLSDQGLTASLKAALTKSHSALACKTRAAQWLAVTKDAGRQGLARSGVEVFDSASELLNAMEIPGGDPMKVTRAKEALKNARRDLIEGGYKDPANHSASSSCYYTLLLSLAVRQVLLDL